MTPLMALLTQENLTGFDALTENVLAELQDHGFAGTLERWLRKLGPVISGDAFSAERGRLLVAAAVEFDLGGRRDVAEFLDFAERYTVRDLDAAGVIRVMTVHKAKGLGFDVVILPDLEGKTLTERRDGLAVQKAPDRSVEWVFDLPAKIFCERDPVLAEYVMTAEADAAYENLCLLYVAMTRAKRALYIVTEPRDENSTARNFPRLLQETLGQTWSAGDPRWFEDMLPSTPATTSMARPGATDERIRNLVATRPRRKPALRPSAFQAGEISAAQVFALEGAAGMNFGTMVHELFAEVEWGGPAVIGPLSKEWAARGFSAEAVGEALACLQAPELARVWARIQNAELWRERAFEIVLDGAWLTGVCDRVLVERDGSGRAIRAAVFDFKTDRLKTDAEVADAAERHAAQLNIYRRVIARLARLPVASVTGELVFTRLRRLVRVGGEISRS